MKVIAINGSPRKNKNTAQMLQNALEGAKNNGAETKMIHLSDLNYSGCKSCFACKAIDKKSYGMCVCKDDLTAILQEIEAADVLILGSPFYFQSVTGTMRMFLERLLFPYLKYESGYPTLFQENLEIAFMYTMNITKEQLEKSYPFMRAEIEKNEHYLKHILKSCHTLCAYDTSQFDDYTKYESSVFDPEHKKRVHENDFQKSLQEAYLLGEKLSNRDEQQEI